MISTNKALCEKILLIVLLITAFVDVTSAAQKGSHRISVYNDHGKD